MKIEITEQEKEELLKIKSLISSSYDSYKLAQSILKQMFGKKLKKMIFRMPYKMGYTGNSWGMQYMSCYYILNYHNPHMLYRLINSLIRERNAFYKG